MNSDLSKLRAMVCRLFVAWLWVHVPVCAVCAWAAGNGFAVPTAAAVLMAGAATAAWAINPTAKSTRLTIGVAYIGIISILVAACRGSFAQIDLHMYYFAALAILVAFCDAEVILAAAGATALHHLGLNFLAPALVFPDGANFPRVILHAVIVVLETAALISIIHYILKLLKNSALHLAASEAALSKVQQAEEIAAAMRQSAAAERQAGDAALQIVAHEQAQVVTALSAGLARLASGNLYMTLETVFPPASETLRADFNAAVLTLQAAFRAMMQHTASMHLGTDEIKAATGDLATRTEQQAAQLEQTAGSLASITEAIKVTASRAARAREVVAAASGDSARSGTVVAEVVEAMGSIAASSKQIRNIVGVIEDIAFQTNLLALNAGVEAARAGDAGRGFAVVAMEVRALAQRSADAAKEIKILIQTSENEVKTGVDRVGVTGEVLRRLTAQVVDIEKLVDEISASSGQQAATLGGVNEALGRMEQSTQRTAAMVEQTNAATESLAGEARALSALSARFQVNPASFSPSARPTTRTQAFEPV